MQLTYVAKYNRYYAIFETDQILSLFHQEL